LHAHGVIEAAESIFFRVISVTAITIEPKQITRRHIGAGVAVAGAFSLIRFRSVAGTANAQFKTPAVPKKFLDELRCCNGKLNIVCGRPATPKDEL